MLVFKGKLTEADDQKIQKTAYDFFQYIAKRGLASGQTIPGYDEKARQAHAEQYRAGVAEFVEALKDYTSGYMRGMRQDEIKHKADYGVETYDRVFLGLRAFSKYA